MYEVEKKQYDRDGFCILKGFFNSDEIKSLVLNINCFIKDEAKELAGRDINYCDGEINSIHVLGEEENYFTEFSSKEKVRKAAEVFLASKPELRGSELFAKPARSGLPSPMHQDNYYWCIEGANALTMWVALDCCSEENGGLTYYRGSHKVGLVKHEDSNAPGSSQRIEEKFIRSLGEKNKVTPVLEPGDVLVHHSLTFHGSSANKSENSRRGFTMQFKDVAAKYDSSMLKHYESCLMKQVEDRET